MDGAGNRTQFVEKDQQGTPVGTTNATYSADNRLLTYGNMTFGYDGNGNRTSKTVNQVTTTYAYNHDNRLTELHDGATLTFTYNGDGLRQSRTVDGTTTQYAYDGVRLLQELDANGATQTTYTLAPLGDEWYPLLSDRKAGASRFYAFDALGTTRALTNQSQLTTHQFTDDAYGNVLSATDPAATPHQYIGKLGYYADAGSGLQLLTQRYYDPAVGRFVTEDPLRDDQNWCIYDSGNPVQQVDPSGTSVRGWMCRMGCQMQYGGRMGVCYGMVGMGLAGCTVIYVAVMYYVCNRGCRIVCTPMGPAMPLCYVACGAVCEWVTRNVITYWCAVGVWSAYYSCVASANTFRTSCLASCPP